MKKLIVLLLPIFLILYACNSEPENTSVNLLKNEVLETEKNFAIMTKEKGIPEAFIHYAADNAVLFRNDTLVLGRDRISEYFNIQATEYTNVNLTWKPDFVDVATSGELAYTYGRYTYTYIDSSASEIQNTGVFHTIWKKQADGSWRYVWD